MSKIAVNEITDEVGTGAPAFPNGMSVTGAALTDPEITGGIYLGGTGSANYLDDYEEGTWTPVFQNYDGTVSINGASYSKVGSIVFTFLNVTFNGADSSQISLSVSSLPFNVLSDNRFSAQITFSSASNPIQAERRFSNSIVVENESGGFIAYNNMDGADLGMMITYISS